MLVHRGWACHMRLVTVALGVGGALESPHKADLASRILRDLNAFVPFQECADSLMSAFVCSSCAVCDSSAPLQSARAQDMSHRGEGKAVLVISQLSHSLSVSLNNKHGEEPEAHASGACLLLYWVLSCLCPVMFVCPSSSTHE